MEIIRNSRKSSHKEYFNSYCAQSDELIIVSPFCFSDFKDFADELAKVDLIHKVLFITTLKKEEVVTKIDPLLSFYKEMDRIGVQWELRIDNILHGKIYIFKKDGVPYAGIITSANLTHNGMVANHEWGSSLMMCCCCRI